MKRAIYALSADPITFGHINIINRASEMFDELVVAIGDNPQKTYTLEAEERLKIVKKYFEKNKNISVYYFNGALVDFSYKVGANIIVRGLRNINDFQYEQELAAINKSLKPNLETCFILTEPNQSHVSSSSSKSLVKAFFSAIEYLPVISKKALEIKINEQKYIGITGLMGSGKSYIAEELDKKYSDVFNVDLDSLCNEVYNEENKAFSVTRENILNIFGTLNKKEIGKVVFSDPFKLKALNVIFEEPLKILIRDFCKGKKGFILLNGATLVAENFLSYVNNQIIFVDTEKELRYERCKKGRSIDQEIIEARDKIMISAKNQISITKEKIKKDNYGKIIVVKNNDVMTNNKDEYINIDWIYEEMVKLSEI